MRLAACVVSWLGSALDRYAVADSTQDPWPVSPGILTPAGSSNAVLHPQGHDRESRWRRPGRSAPGPPSPLFPGHSLP
jgi:hypothetical protein